MNKSLFFALSVVGLLLSLLPSPGHAQAAPAAAGLPAGVIEQARRLAHDAAAARAPAGARIEVQALALDPRLRLAPCERIEALPLAGQPAWGRTRVGLRCAQGAVAWQVPLPLTVQVFAPAVVLVQAVASGAELSAAHLGLAEVDWSASTQAPFADPAQVLGRVLARDLPAGSAPRGADLRQRQWFAAGETVRIVARGPGFAISSEGQALTVGVDGTSARVRTEGGRVVTGRAVGDRLVEVVL